jgi:glycosyltransferase involved in cell wall biosynthesis
MGVNRAVRLDGEDDRGCRIDESARRVAARRMTLQAHDRPPWVLVSAGFHERGGQARAVAALADHLLATGRPVHLVAHEVAGRFRDRSDVTFHPVRRPAGADFLGSMLLRRRGRAVAKRVLARHPEARVVSNGGCCDWPDINWVHYVHAAWHRAGRGAPLWFRGKAALAGRSARRRESCALRAARLVIANSFTTRDELINRLGISPEQIETTYYGCDPLWTPPSARERAAARFWLNQPERRPLAVFVGGLGYDQRKGFDTLWTAWKHLCDRSDWDVDLVAAGGGHALRYWQVRTAAAGLQGRLRFLGFTERVFDVLAAADLLVSPARYEAYGLNVQEAICRGVPAIVSAAAGVAERYTPDVSAMILSDPHDADVLAQLLLDWRNHLDQWSRRFRLLSTSLHRHTWQSMAEQLVARSECSGPAMWI